MIARDLLPIDLYPRIGDERWSDWNLSAATWAFLTLGVVIRLVRYLLSYPLWSDESFVSVNLLGRGYLGLLEPLDYQQVGPILFLWAELAAVRLLGFSEWSLRLIPLLCGMGSLLLFRHVAGRLIRGLPLLLAVGIVAVAVNPVRHSNEVKPYAGDFLVATILVGLVVEWWRRPDRSRWLWGLAAVTIPAIGFSLASTFVVGALSLVLSGPVSRARQPRIKAAFLTFNLAIAVGFIASWAIHGGEASAATRDYMRSYWSDHFPPWEHPLRLPFWFVRAFTGQLFAYPVGGANGASVLTLACVVVGSLDWIRRSRGFLVLILLGPLGMALVAASLRLYPFGETERLMQFEGPMICLLAGHGLAWAIGRTGRPRAYRRRVLFALAGLAAIGLGTIAMDLIRPAKTLQDLRAREFARWFWTEQARNHELACTLADLGLDFEGGPPHHGRSADYACLRQICSPRHRQGKPIDWGKLSLAHPLKCVIYDGVPVDSPLFVRWMELMTRSFRLTRTDTFRVNSGVAPRGVSYEDHLAVLTFVPRDDPVDPLAIAREATLTNFRPRRGSLQVSTPRPSLLP